MADIKSINALNNNQSNNNAVVGDVSGFYNSLTANEPLAIVFYVALVLTGVTLVFLGIL